MGWDNWDDVVALSFLSYDDSFYELLPYEAITKEEYDARKTAMRPFNPSLLTRYEYEESDFDIGDSDCSTGGVSGQIVKQKNIFVTGFEFAFSGIIFKLR